MAPYAEHWHFLQTLPGIDQTGAATVLAEIGTDLSVFGDASHFASRAALCPGNHGSAGQRIPSKTRKGNHAVRYLLCEIANAARRTHGAFRGKCQSLAGRKGHKKAIVAVAHQTVRTIHALSARRQAYRDPGIDYAALVVDRNAPRGIQALKKHGYWPKPGPSDAPMPAPAR